jgi:hypothetical protein
MIVPVPADGTNLNIYIWNQKEVDYEIPDGKVKIMKYVL